MRSLSCHCLHSGPGDSASCSKGPEMEDLNPQLSILFLCFWAKEKISLLNPYYKEREREVQGVSMMGLKSRDL